MKGYAVHLFFHLLAIACGAGCGVAAALWWDNSLPLALWLAVAAFAAGIFVLIAQGIYISNQPRRSATVRRPGTSAAQAPAHAAASGNPSGREYGQQPPRRHGTRPDAGWPEGPAAPSGMGTHQDLTSAVPDESNQDDWTRRDR